MEYQKLCALALPVVVFVVYSCASPITQPKLQSGYVESGQCKDTNICTYRFTASQQFFQGDLLQNYTLSAVVTMNCYSVGTINQTQATEYCFTVNDVVLLDSPFNDNINQKQQAMINELYSGQFCFVQAENGRIVEISYEEDSHPEGVNLKKTVAAAFQANFQNQEEEEEEDPQSVHVAHYSYESTGDNSSIKMHRSVSSSDIKEFSSGAHVKDLQLEKEEDIEYRSGHLYHSSGSTTVKMVKPQEKFASKLQEGPLNEKLFYANGSYVLHQLHCHTVPSNKRGKRSIRKTMIRGSLKVVVDKGSVAKTEMEDLRKALPSISNVLRNLHINPGNYKLSDQLERLLIVESEFGTLPGFTPALDTVTEFLTTGMQKGLDKLHDLVGLIVRRSVHARAQYKDKMEIEDAVQPDDIAMKNLLYSMLCVEGSHKSQKIIIRALQRASTESERTKIVFLIAFIHHGSPALLTKLEEVLVSTDNHLDPLILAYGALASETTEESEQRIVTFLLNRLEEAENSTAILTYYIHALGNTGSPFALDTIISFHNHSDLEVQLVSISAMRKLIHKPLVEETLHSILQTTPVHHEHVVAIAETLSEGAKYLEKRNVDYVPSMELQAALVEALEVIKNSSRARRGTDWDESNSDYDIVASQASRAADVQNYPKHKAYIWGKKLGNDDANVEIGAGIFAGYHPTCPNLKAFGKAIAQANLLNKWSWNILHVEALLEKTDSQLRIKMYFKRLDNVLTDWSSTINCATPPMTVYSSPRLSLPRLSYSVFIYVGTLTLYLQPHVQADVDFQANICDDSTILRARAGVEPRFTFTIEGGVQGDISELVKGGATFNAIFEFHIEGSAEERLCPSCVTGPLRAKVCIGVSEGWPNNRINVESWYQTRTASKCKGKVTKNLPCGIKWGPKQRWDKFSTTWSLPSQQMTSIYNTCGDIRDPTCPSS